MIQSYEQINQDIMKAEARTVFYFGERAGVFGLGDLWVMLMDFLFFNQDLKLPHSHATNLHIPYNSA